MQFGTQLCDSLRNVSQTYLTFTQILGLENSLLDYILQVEKWSLPTY